MYMQPTGMAGAQVMHLLCLQTMVTYLHLAQVLNGKAATNN